MNMGTKTVDKRAHTAEPLDVKRPRSWPKSMKQMRAGRPVMPTSFRNRAPFMAIIVDMLVQAKAAINWAMKKAMTKKPDRPLTALVIQCIMSSAFLILRIDTP